MAKKAEKPVIPFVPKFDLYVVSSKSSNYGERRYHLYRKPPSIKLEVSSDKVEVGVFPSGQSIKDFCKDFPRLIGCGALEPNQVYKWTITAEKVKPTAKMKAKLIAAAQKV